MSEMVGLRRGVTLLDALSQAPQGLSFGEIEALLSDASPSTITRLLKVMLDETLIIKESAGQRYQLGERSKRIAHNIATPKSKAEAIQQAVDLLGRSSEHSAAYMNLGEHGITMVAKSEQPEGIHYLAIGQHNSNTDRHGFYRTALAHASQEERQRLQASTDSDWDTIAASPVWINTTDDRPGLTRIVAPVFIDGILDGVIGVSFFYSDDAQTVANHVSTIAQSLSHSLSNQG